MKRLTVTEAATLLECGELVAIPTETVYGLAASIRFPSAIEQIFTVKKRPSDNPLIIHLHSEMQLHEVASSLPNCFETLFAAFMPGPLTLVVKKSSNLPSSVTRGLESVAIRFPSHPVAREILQLVNQPLVAPSANLSGRPSPTTAAHVFEDFEGTISGVVDGGPCSCGLESTVLSILNPNVPVLLRPGAITKEQLEAVLGLEIGIAGKTEPVVAPGMKYRHYAPKAKVFLVDTLPEPRPGIALKNEISHQELYAFLRLCDQENIQTIFIQNTPQLQQDAALMNRIEKIIQSR